MPLTLRDPKFFFAVLSTMMLRDPAPQYVFDQFATKEMDYTKTLGDTITLNRYPYFGEAGLTLAARTLSETTTIGTDDPVSITADQVTILLNEISGPFNNASVPAKVAPLGITEKTARRANHKLIDADNPEQFFNSIGGKLLQDDHDRLHDRVLCNLLLTSGNTTNPSNKADVSTLVTDKITCQDLRLIKRKLQIRNIRPFDDGYYVGVIDPFIEKHLGDDLEFQTAISRQDPERVWRGEIGKFGGFRFITSTNIPTETVNALTARDGLFFGPDAVGYGVGLNPEVRKNKNDDYERFLYLIWLSYKGYALLDARFVEVGRTFALT